MALNILRRRGLTPLAPGGSGGGGASYRPANMPALVTGALPLGAGVFEDFTGQSVVANAFWASGLTATPDTLVNLAPIGHPNWVATETGSGSGSINMDYGAGAGGTFNGICQVRAGTTANDMMIMDNGGTANPAVVNWTSTQSCIFQMRFAFSSPTTSNLAIGLIGNTVAVGTDWLTNPDVTLAAADGCIIHRNSAGYSGDGAADIVLRYYDNATTTNMSTVLSTVTSGAYHKVELYFNGPAALLYAYYNGALVAGFPVPMSVAGNCRASAAAQSLATTGRLVTVDSFYWETQLVAAR